MFRNSRLVVLDFDGTVGDTHIAHFSVPGVNEACSIAFQEMFGGTVGTALYEAAGGLQNRSPAEITEAVISGGNKEELLQSLRKRLPEFKATLHAYVPEGKGIPLEWDEEHPYRFATEVFVRFKLRAMRIGVRRDGLMWPRPCGEVLPFLELLRSRSVEVGIISSGHERFIRNCFELWHAQCPELMLTDDDLRNLPIPLAERTKPSPRLFDFLLERLEAKIPRTEIIYIGDDHNKDGLLAHNSKVAFGWYNPAGKPVDQELPLPDIIFRDWSELRMSNWLFN